jgi:hypothetical protein
VRLLPVLVAVWCLSKVGTLLSILVVVWFCLWLVRRLMHFWCFDVFPWLVRRLPVLVGCVVSCLWLVQRLSVLVMAWCSSVIAAASVCMVIVWCLSVVVSVCGCGGVFLWLCLSVLVVVLCLSGGRL